MQFRIDKDDLLRGLHLTHSIADKKATVPILANVLIRTVGKESVLFVATDLKTIITVIVPAKIEEEGGITVSARQVHEIAKGLSTKEVFLRRTEQSWLELRCGKSEFKLVGMSDRDYPKLPNFEAAQLFSVATPLFSSLISKTFFSISQDDTRSHLASVFFECDAGKATFVSTDGHRLSKASAELNGAPTLSPGILIPRRGVAEIRRALEGREAACEIGVDQGYFLVRADHVSLMVKLWDGQFPPYEQVIPKENDKKVVVDRDILLDGIKRVAIIASEKTWGVKFALTKGLLAMEVENPDLGNARESMEVDYQGEDLKIGFNARYLIDVLSEMKDKEVLLEMGGDLDPGVLKPAQGDDYVGVIMPIRL